MFGNVSTTGYYYHIVVSPLNFNYNAPVHTPSNHSYL